MEIRTRLITSGSSDTHMDQTEQTKAECKTWWWWWWWWMLAFLPQNKWDEHVPTRDGNARKWKRQKAGVQGLQEAPNRVQGQGPWFGSGSKASDAGDSSMFKDFKYPISPTLFCYRLCETCSSQYSTQRSWFHTNNTSAQDRLQLQVHKECTHLKQTPRGKRMHIQFPCLVQTHAKVWFLLKGRASCHELCYDRPAVYIEFYLSKSMPSTSTMLLLQYFHSVLPTAVHGTIYWLNIFWRSRTIMATVLLLSITLDHFSTPITKFQLAEHNSLHRSICYVCELIK